MVPYRETISAQPSLQPVEKEEADLPTGTVLYTNSGQTIMIRLRALPLAPTVHRVLQASKEMIEQLEGVDDEKERSQLRDRLKAAIDEAIKDGELAHLKLDYQSLLDNL